VEKAWPTIGGEISPIKIIDRGQKNIHYDLIFTAEDSKRGKFKGHPKDGQIAAELCEDYGRITLRAVPSK